MKEWTPEEKKMIVDQYRSTGYANCPIDNEVLKVIRMPIQQTKSELLEFHCRHCGRKFRPSEHF